MIEDPKVTDSVVVGRRKFMAFLIAVLGCFALRVFDLLPSDQFSHILIAALGAYMAGNVGEHFATRGQDGRYLNH
jgi:hypothetical protein